MKKKIISQNTDYLSTIENLVLIIHSQDSLKIALDIIENHGLNNVELTGKINELLTIIQRDKNSLLVQNKLDAIQVLLSSFRAG